MNALKVFGSGVLLATLWSALLLEGCDSTAAKGDAGYEIAWGDQGSDDTARQQEPDGTAAEDSPSVEVRDAVTDQRADQVTDLTTHPMDDLLTDERVADTVDLTSLDTSAQDTSGDADSDQIADNKADTGPDLAVEDTGPDADQETTVWPEAWEGSYLTAFSAKLTGQGSHLVGGIQIQANKGTLVVNGSTVDVVVTEQIEWDTQQGHYSLYQVLGPVSDGLYVAYVYCLGTVLNYVYVEGFDQPMAGESASGSCNVATSQTTVQAEVQAMVLLPSPPPQLAGVSLQGAQIDITNGIGDSSVAGGLDVTLFGYVDCLTCPSTDGNGWLEFHSVLSSEFPEKTCFGIFYYYPATTQVQLGWGFCLSDFTFLSGASLGTATLNM